MEPLFSICVLAKNEEKALPEMFKSLAEFRERDGDIVLLDTGSTDATIEMAAAFGCNVLESDFRFPIKKEFVAKINSRFVEAKEAPIVKYGDTLFNYGEARNFAAAAARNDMIVVMDPDETISVDIDKMNERILEGPIKMDVEFQDNPMSIFRADYRIYDRRHFHWHGVIHEMLKGTETGPVAVIDPGVFRFEHHAAPHEHRGRYLASMAWTCYFNQTDQRKAHAFGRQLLYEKRYLSAVAQLKRHIAMKPVDNETYQSMTFIGDCYRAAGYETAAVEWYQASINTYADRREPWLRLADLYFAKKDAKRTAAYAMAALALPYVEFYGNRPRDYGALPHAFLYWALYQIGSMPAAKKHWEFCRHLEPENLQFIGDGQFFQEDKDVRERTQVPDGATGKIPMAPEEGREI